MAGIITAVVYDGGRGGFEAPKNDPTKGKEEEKKKETDAAANPQQEQQTHRQRQPTDPVTGCFPSIPALPKRGKKATPPRKLAVNNPPPVALHPD